jgi:hypothetical protein
MRSIKMIARGLAAAALVTILSFSAFADTIRLKDGGIIKGRIVGFTGGKFRVVIGDGPRQREMTFTSDEVASIQFDQGPGALNTARTNTPIRRNPTVINVNGGTKSTAPRPAPAADAEPVEVEETVAQAPVRPEPKPSTPVASAPSRTVTTAPVKTPPLTQPVALNVKVLSDNTANGWTNSGWVVRKGQKIKITGDGRVSLGNGKFSTSSGAPELNVDQNLLKGVATGALIAVIGDDNNDFLYIGAEREFVATRDGTLFLGVNEGNLNDNSGTYDVKIEIAADSR